MVASPGGSWDRGHCSLRAQGSWESDALDAGDGDAAFCAVRRPATTRRVRARDGFLPDEQRRGHAASLATRRRCSWSIGTPITATVRRTSSTRPDVMYVSLHEWPLYPGTGRVTDRPGRGVGTTVNVPLPAGATGDVLSRSARHACRCRSPEFAPDWVLISSGYDAHRDARSPARPVGAGDFTDLTTRVARWRRPAAAVVAFLEGGYDLDALRGRGRRHVRAGAGGRSAARARHLGRSRAHGRSQGPGRASPLTCAAL